MKALIDRAADGLKHFQRVLFEGQLLRAAGLEFILPLDRSSALRHFSACSSSNPQIFGKFKDVDVQQHKSQ